MCLSFSVWPFSGLEGSGGSGLGIVGFWAGRFVTPKGGGEDVRVSGSKASLKEGSYSSWGQKLMISEYLGSILYRNTAALPLIFS